MHLKIAVLSLALFIGSAVPGGAQTSMPAPVPAPIHIAINADTLKGLPRKTINATDEHGHAFTFTGVALDDLLVKAGAPHGEPVRGKVMLSYVLITAADNYHVLFTMPELDPSFTDHTVLIAETVDGAPIAADSGPYRLITPYDKRNARWVKKVTAVDLQNVSTP
jgi:hypothetical protein